MSDFEDRLNTLLNDPESMAQIMQLAKQLGGENRENTTTPPPPSSAAAEEEGFDPAMLSRFMPLLQEMKNADAGETAQFLRALRPYLRAEKQGKVEKAVRIARLIRIGKSFFRSLGDDAYV